MKIKYCIPLLALLAVFHSCAPTVKSETYAYNNNQEKIRKFITAYPQFEGSLEKLAEDATEVFNQAGGISDEKEKIAKMAEANRLVNTDRLFTQLKRLDALVLNLENSRQELRAELVEEYQLRIQDAMDISWNRMEDAADTLRRASPGDYEDALKKVTRAYESLLRAEDILNQTKKYISEREAEKKQKAADADLPKANKPQEDDGGRTTVIEDDGSRDNSGGTDDNQYETEEEDLGGRD